MVEKPRQLQNTYNPDLMCLTHSVSWEDSYAYFTHRRRIEAVQFRMFVESARILNIPISKNRTVKTKNSYLIPPPSNTNIQLPFACRDVIDRLLLHWLQNNGDCRQLSADSRRFGDESRRLDSTKPPRTMSNDCGFELFTRSGTDWVRLNFLKIECIEY